MSNNLVEISQFLSYALRHQPDAIGVTLDREGWTDISSLLTGAACAGKQLDLNLIQTVVARSDKNRFEISFDGLRIRAVQGHSTDQVRIEYSENIPPELLYHGTATRFLESIRKEGLLPGSRHYVHLSEDTQSATAVGRRHGKPIVLVIAAGIMYQQEFRFYLAPNGIWLTSCVPSQFIAEEFAGPVCDHSLKF